MDVGAWLSGLGLERLAEIFRSNEIDWDILPELSEADLEKLGIALGPRKRLLKAIAELGAAPPRAQGPSEAAEERRQITILFCDLVGSTALSARLDPEDLRALVAAYHKSCTEAVSRNGGRVAQYLGDGVMAYFGHPQAHEDDAERAVRAGLAAIDAVASLASSERLDVRIGIATGLVVTGEIGTGEAQLRGAMGETPNRAARLQAAAEPGTIVIDQRTRQLLGGLFDCRDLGTVEMKGIAAPQRLWQVAGESAAESRFEALRALGTTELVGRDEELELLLRRWAQAKRGEGRVVLLSGEPGIGKSRLVTALHERVAAEPHLRLRYFCSPNHQDSALHPVIAHLERAAGLVRDDGAAAKLDKIEALLAPSAPSGEEIALIAELLSVPLQGRHPVPALSAQRKKEKTLAALIRPLENLAREKPVMMVYEDVHWIDPSSREQLDMLVDRVRGLPILLVVTFRQEFDPPWTGQAHVTLMALNRLGRGDGAALVRRIVGNEALSAEIVREIVERTDGVPLFVEEVTKAVLEGGAPLAALAPAALSIPATLHASLMARLDRLGTEAQEAAQVGAVIGREFSYELLAAVTGRPDPQLRLAVNQLAKSGLVFCRGVPPDATLLFKHALIQDAAYGTLLRARRQQLHANVARALQERFADLVEARPEIVAHHLTEAGEAEAAIKAWLKAAQKGSGALRIEAINQLRKAIELTSSLPDERERWCQELHLQIVLGRTLAAIRGFPAPETGEAYASARALCEKLGDQAALVPVLAGQSAHHCLRAQFSLARRHAEDLLRLAGTANDKSGLVNGHRNMGVCLIALGEQVEARWNFEEALRLYTPDMQQAAMLGAAFEARAHALSVLSFTLFIQGYADQARKTHDEGIRWSRQLGHIYSLHTALVYAGLFHYWLGDDDAALAASREGIAVAGDHANPMWVAWANIPAGHLLCKRGDGESGLALARQGLRDLADIGAMVYISCHLGIAAEACRTLGRTTEALELLAQALHHVETTGEQGVVSELLRLKGEILIADDPGRADEAKALLRRGIAIAHAQSAKTWELRSAVSLARILRDEGWRDAALEALAPVYGWFTEGFDTKDLVAAKTLLDELRAG